MKQRMRKELAVAIVPIFLAACGGGNGAADSNTTASNTTGGAPTGTTAAAGPIVLQGQVSDGPIAGAKVCLYVDGVLAKDGAGAAICSAATDAQGNYSLSMPRDLAGSMLTLVASKDSSIKLASVLGDLAQVVGAAGKDGTVGAAALPTVQISHITTADFALADTNKDDKVSKAEFTAYVSSYARVRPVAAVVKAVIDGGQVANLVGGATRDTLALAQAAARSQPLGPANLQIAKWVVDPANAILLAAVDQQVASSEANRFANYRLSTVVTSSQLAAATSVSNATVGVASLSCQINTNKESATVQIAIDKARGVFVLKHDDVQTVGTYDYLTGALSLVESDPLAVTMVSPAGVTYYSEGYFKLAGSLDPATGEIKGTYAELTANTWSLDSTRKECTANGALTATKL